MKSLLFLVVAQVVTAGGAQPVATTSGDTEKPKVNLLSAADQKKLDDAWTKRQAETNKQHQWFAEYIKKTKVKTSADPTATNENLSRRLNDMQTQIDFNTAANMSNALRH